MEKGQVTIPKDVQEILGVVSGDRVSFVVEGNKVQLVNSAVYAMQILHIVDVHNSILDSTNRCTGFGDLYNL